MNEATLTKNLGALIRARGGWARKAHGGPHMSGWPDLICIYRGVPLWLEVKLPGRENTLTTKQALTLQEAKAAGGIARMVSSKAQVTALLDKIDEVKDGHREGKAHKSRQRSRTEPPSKRARNTGRDS
jgi:hypothetical protein